MTAWAGTGLLQQEALMGNGPRALARPRGGPWLHDEEERWRRAPAVRDDIQSLDSVNEGHDAANLRFTPTDELQHQHARRIPSVH